MKKIRLMLVLMFLIMSSISAKAYVQKFLYPYVYEIQYDVVCVIGLDIDPTVKTLVIPNKIDGYWVWHINNRSWQWKTKDRPRAGGGWWSKWNEIPFSIFARNCNVEADGYYDTNPAINPDHQYNPGEVPTSFDTSILGTPLSLEEIVVPYKVWEFDDKNNLYGLSSLKRLYLRSPEIYFKQDLYGCTNLEEIHFMCDVPYYMIDDSRVPHKINLYVPQKYYNNYLADPEWGNSPSFNILPEPTTGATLKIKNTYPGLLIKIDDTQFYGRDGSDYVATLNYGKYYMPRYKVSYSGVGEIKVKLNGQYLDDFEDELSLLDLVPGENTLEAEIVTSSEITFTSNGNGSVVKWNGSPILNTNGGTYKVTDVKSNASNSFEVAYNTTNKDLVVKCGSNFLTPTSTSGNNAVFQLGKVLTDLKYDIEVTDKPCAITVNKTNVDGNLLVQREVDGKASFMYLTDGITFTAGQGTTLRFEVPNTMSLSDAQLGGANATISNGSGGVKTYTFTVPTSPSATLRLVGQSLSSGLVNEYYSYTPQFLTKMGNGTVMYEDWFIDRDDNRIPSIGELTTPVTTLLAPYSLLLEDCSGWTLTMTPDPGYQLTTLYGSWDMNEQIANVPVLSSINFLTEEAYIDNETGTYYHEGGGPTAEQKLAAGGDFSLDLEVGRTLSYNASTRTWTLNIEGNGWETVSMNITIGFTNPDETNQKQMSVVAVGQPTEGSLSFGYKLSGTNSDQYEMLRSAGSFTKLYQLGDFKNPYFLLGYEDGYEIEGNGGQVTIPFTVYHNGEDATNQFNYEDGQILCYLNEETMAGNWTFIFPEEAQTAEAKWTFLKSGEGALRCEVEPLDASAESTTLAVGDESRTLRIRTADTESATVIVQPSPGYTFKAYCNGSEVTGDFTLVGSEYALATNQADLRDANWTVLFSEDGASNYFTYQLNQTAGGEVSVGVIPVGGLSDGTSAEISVIEDGSTTLRLTSAEAEGIILFVEPEQNMTVRIYQGDTDVTSQFTYDSETNSYMRQTSSLADESLLFVFADKDRLGIDIIDFADAEVKRICVENWDTNGDRELSKAEAAAVTTLKKDNGDGTLGDPVFKGNSVITSFDELQYFTGLTTIDEFAFNTCTALASVKLPAGVKTLHNYSFKNCSSLQHIQLPEGLDKLNTEVFANTGLASIFIPKSVTSVSEDAFVGCAQLQTIVVEDGTSKYSSPNGCNAVIYKRSSIIMLQSGCKNTVIPDNVVMISQKAFKGQTELTKIVIPSSVGIINQEAFYGCSNLTSVVMEKTTPPAFGTGAFSAISADCILIVPEGTRDAYIEAGWTENIFKGGIVEAPEYDANGDGKTTIVDVTRLVDKIIGK